VNVLAIETSSEIGSIVLAIGADTLERRIEDTREQAGLIVPLIDELLASRGASLGDLDAVVFGRGPGSFTGLRLAAAVAQGLATSRGLPLVAVSSLQAIAVQAERTCAIADVVVAIDARMGEVYTGGFRSERGLMRCVSEERLTAPGRLCSPDAGAWVLAGNAITAHAAALESLAAGAAAVLPDIVPTASDLLPQAAADLAQGRTLAPGEALPVYLRGESAWRRQT
jgi:tRNA threonylcarbamoyladenosine biosynthesis protein TsaB